MSTPKLYNISVRKDTSYSVTFNFFSDRCKTTALDLSSHSFEAEVRASNSSGTIVETLNFDTEYSADGKITMFLSDTETLALSVGEYVWDMKVTLPDSSVDRWVYGTFNVIGTVTR